MTTSSNVPRQVPDGGWGWVVCLASFWTNGVVFGVINSFGVIFVHLMTLPGATAFKISWIGSVAAGLNFFMCPFASIFTDKLGCRTTAVIGSCLALVGVFTSSLVKSIEFMYITYGFVMGLGFAVSYQPSIFILGLYFQKRMGLANGLVCFGSSVFTVVLPLITRQILNRYGFAPCMWFQTAIVFIMLLGGFTFRPRPKAVQRSDLKDEYNSVSREEREDDENFLEMNGDMEHIRISRGMCSNPFTNVIDFSIWKIRNYRIWAIAVPIGMFGYFVPFFHLIKHVNETIPDAPAEVLIMCLGATSGIGRLVSGFISDHPKFNPVYIQQLSFVVIGVCTALMPIANNFIGLCVLILIMGLFDGSFVTMIGVIVFKLVGREKASQGIGSVLGLMSFPMMIGPPIAGFIYDYMGTYDIAFVCAGIPPLVCASIIFLLRFEPEDDIVNGHDDEEVDEAVESRTTYMDGRNKRYDYQNTGKTGNDLGSFTGGGRKENHTNSHPNVEVSYPNGIQNYDYRHGKIGGVVNGHPYDVDADHSPYARRNTNRNQYDSNQNKDVQNDNHNVWELNRQQQLNNLPQKSIDVVNISGDTVV